MFRRQQLSSFAEWRCPGFSLVELLVVSGIVAVLMGLLIPAVFSARQLAQSTACSERIRQLSLGVCGYESARQHIPPATLGFDQVIDFDDWFDDSSPFYWKRAQYTSWLALTIPHLQAGDYLSSYDSVAINERILLADLLDPITGQPQYDNFARIPGFGALAAKELSEFRCPADHLQTSNALESVFGALQVCTTQRRPRRLLTWRQLLDEPSGEFGLSNYSGCVGSHSGGVIRGDDEGNARRGMMTYRHGLPVSRVKDGLSHTILFGETIGEVVDGVRSSAQNWLVGGVARGNRFLDFPDFPMLGSATLAFRFSFGSVHPAGVWICFGDGHAVCIDRSVDERLFQLLCGIADGRRS